MESDLFDSDLAKALTTLRSGGLLLYPTDTIWGLGCDATDDDAVSRLFELKLRPEAKAMLSLVDSLDSLSRWVSDIPEVAVREILSSTSPLTVIYDSPKGISGLLKAPDGSAAFRITKEEFSSNLCRRFGKPVVSTSANISGQPYPAAFNAICEDIRSGIDYTCLYGRDKTAPKPSRILKISNDGVVSVIR